MRYFIWLIVIILFVNKSQAQDSGEKILQIGVFADYNYNIHNVEFSKLDGIPNCCPDFKNGAGSGLSYGAIVKYPFNDLLSLSLRTGMFQQDGLLSSIESELINIDFEPTKGEYEHTIDARFSSFGFGLGLDVSLIKNLNLSIGGMLYFLTNNDFSQKEQIVTPSDRGTFFETGTSVRNEYSGEIPKTNAMSSALFFSLSYDLPLNSEKTLFLSPEINYSHGLSDMITYAPWKINSISAGLAISYVIYKENEVPQVPDVEIFPKEELIPDIPLAVTPELKPELKIVTIEDGKEYDTRKIFIEEIKSTELQPLLNYIFFDDNSQEIPDRYSKLTKDEIEEFTVDSLRKGQVLHNYYHLLNIIGTRMNQYSESEITLTGCNSDVDNEKNNIVLSRKRADVVRDYLSVVWGINRDRINIKTRNLPFNASNQDNPNGIAENRRVEISSTNPHIIAPLMISEISRKITPSNIRIYPNVINDSLLSDWTITAFYNGAELKSMKCSGPIPRRIEWDLNDNKNVPTGSDDNIKFVLKVKNSQSSEWSDASAFLETDKIYTSRLSGKNLAGKEIDKFSLILFEYNSREISSDNYNIVKIIKDHIKEKSMIKIAGFTDAMGDDEYNLQLSLSRAKNVFTLLDHSASVYTGRGESELLYDNKLPEGRFYCRTVEITIETPIDNLKK